MVTFPEDLRFDPLAFRPCVPRVRCERVCEPFRELRALELREPEREDLLRIALLRPRLLPLFDLLRELLLLFVALCERALLLLRTLAVLRFADDDLPRAVLREFDFFFVEVVGINVTPLYPKVLSTFCLACRSRATL